MITTQFLHVAEDLELAGLLWQPEIGDEVAKREESKTISILVDPHGMTPEELRSYYLWLPSVEQMVLQIEVRQGVLQHTGLELSEKAFFYKTIIQCNSGPIESKADSLRLSMGMALRNFLLNDSPQALN